MSKKEFDIEERQALANVPQTAMESLVPKVDLTVGAYDNSKNLQGARIIPIDKIRPHKKQPRKTFHKESIDELAASIKEHGILQPLIVEYFPDDEHFQIVMGERRYRAAHSIGLRELPCLVRTVENDARRLAQQLIENVQREDLSPIDKALAMIELKESLGQSGTWAEVERLLGISETRRKQFVALLNLPEKLQYEIVALGHRRAKNQITEKHARALLKLNQQPDKQSRLFMQLKNGNGHLSGERAMALALKWTGRATAPHTFSIKYTNKRDLLLKLKAEVKRLQAEVK